MTPYRWRIWAVLLWIGSLFVPRVIAAIDIPGTKIIAFFLLIAGFGSVIFEILALPGMRRVSAVGPLFHSVRLPTLRIQV